MQSDIAEDTLTEQSVTFKEKLNIQLTVILEYISVI